MKSSRKFRFVEPGTLPGKNLLCIYDRTKNLQIVNYELFNRLSETEQAETLCSQHTSITVAEGGKL